MTPSPWESKSPNRISRRNAITSTAGGLVASGQLIGGRTAHADAPVLPRSDFDATYTAKADTAICRGLELLIDRQRPDGSFMTETQGKWIGICSLVGLAWLSRGIRPGVGVAGRALERTAEFVLNNCQANGLITAKQSSRGPMYDHGFGTLFLAELFGTGHDTTLRKQISEAVRLIVRAQNPDGGWRYDPVPKDADLSITVSQMMALRAARNAGFGVPKETIDQAVQYVKRSQNPDGGFMYQVSGGATSRFPLTAAGVVALYSAGIYEGGEIDQAIEYLRLRIKENRTPGRDNFFFYAHYYSTQAFLQTSQDDFAKWYVFLRDVLLSHQNDKGGWFDTKSIEYATAMSCLILNMPRTLLPIFQR